MDPQYEEALNLVSVGAGKIVSALGGAFAGAGVAFWFQNRRENKIKRNAQFEALVRAQHALYFMWSVVAGLRYKYLDESRTDPKRHRMLRINWLPEHHVPIDFNALTFLHRQGSTTLLTQLYVAERAYLSAIDAVRERNQLVFRAIPTPDKEYQFDPKSKLLGMRVDPLMDSLLESATTALYHSVDGGMSRCEDAFAELRKAAKRMFPKNKPFLRDENLTKDGFFASHGQKAPADN
ncbi:MAG: hypothetical protein ABIZ04_21915 [Opitutus sp.]